MKCVSPCALPKAVVFDLGKVLLDFDYGLLARAMAPRSRCSDEEISRLIEQAPLLLDYESGRLSTDEFFHALKQATGYEGTLEECGRFYGDIFSPIEPMIALHAALQARGVATVLFSNTNALAIKLCEARFPFILDFGVRIYSFEHGAMKPEARLYEVVERATGLCGADLLYLDDRAENIAAGAARGWRVIHHLQPEVSLAQVRDCGLLD